MMRSPAASGHRRPCSQVPVPPGAQRIDVPVKYMRVLLRVALGADWDDAVALQRQFELRTIGQPALPTIPRTPIFDIEALLGVEAFEAAELALDSEADINPGWNSSRPRRARSHERSRILPRGRTSIR